MMKSTIMNKMNRMFTAALLIGMAVFTGCSMDSDPNMGTMQVKLHDAPADYDAVNIFIERVEVNNTAGDEGWQTISEPNQSYDLLELTNGVFEMIADVELEEGTYPQIRLILSRDNNSVVVDGQENSLTIPSGSETGVKLNVNAEIKEGIVYTLLLDFDALRSVVQTGQAESPGYILKPVIRATNEALTGNIGGEVQPIEARAAVFAISGDDTLSTTYADEQNGKFLLVGLEEGSYTVSVEPREDGFTGTSLSDVAVTLDQTNDVGTITLETP
ncbi:MAG: DUF4382 domain-containing protein [Balneolaceae bacterium]